MAKSAGGKNTGRSEIISELKELRSLIADVSGMKADVQVDTGDIEKANDELSKFNEKIFEAKKTLKSFKSTGQIHYFATQEKALAHLTRAWEEYKKASSEDDKKTASGKLMRWANAYRGAGYSTDSVEKEMFETADRIYESYKTTGKKGESNSQKLWAKDVFEKVFGAAREVGVDVTESDKYWERRARNIRETAKKVTQESVEQVKSEPVELDVAELLKIDESGLDARAKKIMKSLRKTRDKLIDENNEPTDKSLGKNQGPQFLTDYEEFLKYKENSGNKYRIRGIKKTRDIVLQEMGLKDTDEDLAPFKLQAQQNLNKALEKANRAVRRARQKSGAAPAEGSSTEGGNPQTQGSMTQAGEDARDAGQAAKDAAQSFEEAGDKAQKAGKKAAASAEETREAAEETKKAAKEASEAQDEASVGRGGNKPAEDARETAAALNEERDAARGVNEERERIAAASGSGDNTASRARENAAALDEEKKAQQEVNDERSKMDKTSGQNEEPLSYLDAMILKLEEEKEKLKELQDESDKTRKMLDAASDVKELKKAREIIHGVVKNNQTGETKRNAFGFEGNPTALGSLVRQKLSEGNIGRAAAYYGEYAQAGGTDKFFDLTGKDITAELAERYKQAAEAIGKNPDELRKALNEVNNKIFTQREVVNKIEKEVKAAQKEAAAQRKEQAQQEQETNTDWRVDLNEQEIEAVEAYLKKMKALKKEAYNESTALAQAMSLLEKIKKRDISGLMDQFTAPNQASNAMLGKMTNMPVNNQKARNAALRSLNQEEYDRLIQEQTQAVNDALDNKKSDFQQKWAEVADAMLGGDAFADAKPMVKGQILKELEKYADTAKDAIDEINKQWLSGTLDESKFSGKYVKQYIAALDAAKEAADAKRVAKIDDPDTESLFNAGGTTALTKEQVLALQAEAKAYDELIAKKKEYYGIKEESYEPPEKLLNISYKAGNGRMQVDLSKLLPANQSDFKQLLDIVKLEDSQAAYEDNIKRVNDYINDMIKQAKRWLSKGEGKPWDPQNNPFDQAVAQNFGQMSSSKASGVLKKFQGYSGVLYQSMAKDLRVPKELSQVNADLFEQVKSGALDAIEAVELLRQKMQDFYNPPSTSSSSNASTFAADIKSLEGYSSANEDFVNQLIADVITGQKEYDQAMNELKAHIAQRQEEIRAEEELRAKRVRNAGFGEDVKALENYGYADKDFIQKLTVQVLEGTKEYDDAMDELKAHIEQKHAEMMAAAEKSERDNAEIARYDELAKPMLEQMGFTDSRPEGFYRFVDAIREEGIEAEEALRRFADTVGYVYDEVAGKWQKITEPEVGGQTTGKAITSTQELISTLKELEEIYGKFQRPKYEEMGYGQYIDQIEDVEGIDLSEYDSAHVTKENIEKTRQKMMEIYSLYKKITSAINNNAGYYKGVQYTKQDQDALINDFKAYAQNYHELVTQYNDQEGRISGEIGISPEYLETLDVVVQKLTRDFKAYAQEVITDSQAVAENDRLYEEEQKQLAQSNAALKERYILLRDLVIDYAKKQGADKDQLGRIQDLIPFLSDDENYTLLNEWGEDLFGKTLSENVLQDILRILGIEIPEAAGKAKKAISEVGEGSAQPSEQEASKTEPSKKKYRVSPTSPKIKSKSEPETIPPPSKPDTTDESAAADEAAAAAAEKEKAAKEGAAAAAEKKADAEKKDSEATRENAAENQANTDAEDLGEDISDVGGRAAEAVGNLDSFTESAKNAAEAARKAAGIEGESRIISRSGVNGTNASATYELARGMHYTENWSYRNGNEETGEEPGWAMTSARYVINYQALLNDTVTTLKALRKAEADLALAQEQGRGENVTSQIQAQIDLYQKRIDQNATLAEQYEKMRDLEIEDFELRDGYTKRQYDEDLKAQEELINAQSGAKKAKSVDDERKRQAAKQDKEVARAQKYATERLVALKQLESSFTTEGSSRYLSVENDRTAITDLAGKLRTKLEKIIKQNRAMTIDEMDDIITQFGDIKVEGDTRYARSTAKKGDLSRQKVDSLKSILSSDLESFSQQAGRSSGDISHITEEVNKLKEALKGNVSSEFITESFQKLRELRAELKAINEEQRTAAAKENNQTKEYNDIMSKFDNLEKAHSKINNINASIATNGFTPNNIEAMAEALNDLIKAENEAAEAYDHMIQLWENGVFTDQQAAAMHDRYYSKEVQKEGSQASKLAENEAKLQAELKLVKELQDSYIKLAEAEERTEHASTAAGRELGKRQSEQIKKRQKELEERIGDVFGEKVLNDAKTEAEAQKRRLKSAYDADRNQGISVKGLGFGEGDDVEKTWDTLINKALQYQKIVYKRDNGQALTVNEAAFLQKLGPLYEQAAQHADEAKDKFEKLQTALSGAKDNIAQNIIGKYDESIGGLTEENKDMPAAYNQQVTELKANLEQLKNTEFGSSQWMNTIKALDQGLKNLNTDLSMQPVTENAVAQLDRQMANWQNVNSGAGEFLSQVQVLRDALHNVRDQEGFNGIQSDFERVKAAAADAGKTGQSFGEGLIKRFKSLGQYLLSFASFYRIIGTIKQAVSIVTELNDALTEMRKVSSESLSTLEKFQFKTFDLADQVGTNAVAVQKSTAAWLRLGKDFNEAQQAAVDSTKLLNTTEIENIDDATSSLLSITQAYREITREDAIDKINNIGDHFSSSSSDLAQGLKNVSAVLKTQGNDIDQALALLTAGNDITQDISKASMGVRTIALRISGTEEAKNEIQDMGEDIDDFVVRTKSKTDKIIRDYTAVASNAYKGVSVLDENGNLRSTYDILLDISRVYKEIQEEDKKRGTNRAAALVEELAGKTRSQIASSILLNPELLEEAYVAAQNSEGVGQMELDRYLDSISAKVQQLQNRIQELAFTAVDSDFVKTIVDFLSDAVQLATKLVDTIGTLPAILGTVAALFMKGSGLGILDFNKSTKQFSSGILDAIDRAMNKNKLSESLTNWVASNGYTMNDRISIVPQSTSLPTELQQTIDLFPKAEQEALTFGDAISKVTTQSSGFSGALSGLVSIGGTLASAFVSAGISIAAMAAASFVIQKIVDNTILRRQKELERAQKAKDEMDDLISDFQKNRKKIDDNTERYNELRPGVKIDGNTIQNISLTNDEFNEFLDINQQIGDAFPALITGVDNYGNHIVDLGANAEDTSNKLKSVLDAEQKLIAEEAKKNLPDLISNVRNTNKELLADNYLSEDYINSIESLYSVLNGQSTKLTITDPLDEFTPQITQAIKDVLALEEFSGITFGEGGNITGGGDWTSRTYDFSGLPQQYAESFFTQLQTALADEGVMLDYEDALNLIEANATKAASNWKSDVVPSIIQSLYGDASFLNLTEDLQNAISNSLYGLNYDALDNVGAGDFQEHISKTYVRPFVLAMQKAVTDSDKAKLQSDFLDLFNMDYGDLTNEEMQNTVNELLERIFPGDEAIQQEIKIALGYQFVDENGNVLWTSSGVQDDIYAMFGGSTSITASGSRKRDGKGRISSTDLNTLDQKQQEAIISGRDSGALDPDTIHSFEELIKWLDELNNHPVINEDTLATLFGDEAYKESSEKYASNLSSITGAMETIRTEGQLTAEQMKELQDTFPDLFKSIDDFSFDNLGKAGADELSKWIGEIREAMEDMTPEGKQSAQTYIDNLIKSMGNLQISAEDAKQAVRDVIITADDTSAKGIVQEREYNDLIDDLQSHYGEDLDWNIVWQLAVNDQLSGEMNDIYAKYDELKVTWDLEVGDVETQSIIESLTSDRELRNAEKSYAESLGKIVGEEFYDNDIQISKGLIEQYQRDLKNLDERYYNTERNEYVDRAYKAKRNEILQNIYAENSNIADDERQKTLLPMVGREQALQAIQSEADALQRSIDAVESRGQEVSAEQYQSMINNAERQKFIAGTLQQLYSDAAEEAKNAGNITDYLDWTEKANTYADSVANLDQQIIQWADNIQNIDLTHLQNEMTDFQNKSDDLINSLEDASDLEKVSIYYELQTNAQDERANLQSQRKEIINQFLKDNAALRKETGEGFTPDSERYRQYKEDLRGVDEQLKQLTKDQREWVDALMRTPVDIISKALEKEQSKLEKLQSEIELREARGERKTIDDYNAESALYQDEARGNRFASFLSSVRANMYREFSKKDSAYIGLADEAEAEAESYFDAFLDALTNKANTDREKKDLHFDLMQNEITELEQAASRYQDVMSEIEATGNRVTAEQYQNLMNNADAQIDIYDSMIADRIKDLNKAEREGRDADALTYRQEIAEWQSSRSGLRQNKTDWYLKQQETVLNDALNGYEKLQLEQQEVQNQIDAAEAAGLHGTQAQYSRLAENAKSQIENLEQQRTLWQSIADQRAVKFGVDSTYYTDALKQVQDLSAQQNELQAQYIQNLTQPYIDQIDDLGERYSDLQNEQSAIQDNLELREKKGYKTTARDYKRLLKNAQDQKKNIEEQNALLRKQRKAIQDAGGDWSDVQDQIESNNESIRGLNSSIFDYEQSIKTSALTEAQALSSAIQQAMSEMASETGLSTDTILQLKQAFSDLKSMDISTLFYRTADGVKMSVNTLNTLIEAENTLKNNELDEQIRAQQEAMEKEAAANGTLTSAYRKMEDELLNLMNTRSQYFATYQEQLAAIDGHSLIELAKSTANPLDRYDQSREYLKEAYEMYEKGQIGSDDFKAIASYFDINGFSDETTFKENYDRYSQYFTEDATGLVKFWDKLVASGVAAKDELGNYILTMGDVEKAAEAANVPLAVFQDIIMATNDYGADVAFVASVQDGREQLAGLNKELRDEQVKLAQLEASGAEESIIQKQKDVVENVKNSIENVNSATRAAMQSEDVSFREGLLGVEQLWNKYSDYREQAIGDGDIEGRRFWEQMLRNLAKEYKLKILPEFEFDQEGYEEQLENTKPVSINTGINLRNRPQVSGNTLRNIGYDVEKDSYATVFSSAYSNEAETKTVVVTPILPNGEVLNGEQLEHYANELLEGKDIEIPEVQLAMFQGADSVEQANRYSEALHGVQEAFYGGDLAFQALLTTINANQEGLDKVIFGDGDVAEGAEVLEGALDGVLEQLGLGQEYGDALLQVLAQMGFIEMPEITAEFNGEEANKGIDELRENASNPIKTIVDLVTQNEGIQNTKESIKTAFQNGLSNIQQELQEKEHQAKFDANINQISEGVSGIPDSINDASSNILDAVSDVVNAIADGASSVVQALGGGTGDNPSDIPQPSPSNTGTGGSANQSNKSSNVTATNTDKQMSSGQPIKGQTIDYSVMPTQQVVGVSYVPNVQQVEETNEQIEEKPVEQEVELVNKGKGSPFVGDQTTTVTTKTDTSGALSSLKEVASAAAGLGGKTIQFNGDSSKLVAEADKGTAAINRIPNSHNTNITATDNASGTAQRIKDAIAGIKSKVVNIVAKVSGESGVSNLATKIAGLASKTVNVVTNFISNAWKNVTSPAVGTAHSSGTTLGHGYANGTAQDWTVGKDEDALTNEVGQESIVRDGKWMLLPGGPHVEKLKKDDIVFNAEQTEDLIETGKTARRGKIVGGAYANGTANGMSAFAGVSGGWKLPTNVKQSTSTSNTNYTPTNTGTNKKSSKNAKSGIDAFKEWLEKLFDWVEVRVERLEYTIDLYQAKAENNIGYTAKNSLVQSAFNTTKQLISDATRGADKYLEQAEKVREKAVKLGVVSNDASKNLVKLIKSGEIQISEYDEKTREFINDYKEWFDKSLDLTAQVEDLKTQLKELEQTKLDNITEQFESLASWSDAVSARAQAMGEFLTSAGKTVNSADIKSTFGTQIFETSLMIGRYQDELKAFANELVTAKSVFGESSNEYHEAMAQYEEINKSLIEASTQYNELNKQLYELDLTKLEYAMDKLEQFGDKLASIVSLKETRGTLFGATSADIIGESDYSQQIKANNDIIKIMAEDRQKRINEIAQFGWDVDSENYKEAYDAIMNDEKEILNLLESNEKLKESIRTLRWKPFEELQKQIEEATGDYDHLRDLITDNQKFDSEDGIYMTARGYADLALLAQQIGITQGKIADYRKALDKLQSEYKNGNISLETLNESSRDYINTIQSSVTAVDGYKDAIIELYKTQITNENSALQDTIDLRKKALSAKKAYYDYDKNLSEKSKDVSMLKAQIQALQGVSNDAAKAQRAKLQAQLAEAEEDLRDTLIEHQYEATSQGYDQLSEDSQEALDNTIKQLEANAEQQDQIVNMMLEKLQTHYTDAYTAIQDIISSTGTVIGDVAESSINQLETTADKIISLARAMDEFQAQASATANNINTSTITTADNAVKAVESTIKANNTDATIANAKASTTPSGASTPNVVSAPTAVANAAAEQAKAAAAKAAADKAKAASTTAANAATTTAKTTTTTLDKIKQFVNSKLKLNKKQSTSKLSALGKYIFQKSGGRVLTQTTSWELARLLGIAGTPSTLAAWNKLSASKKNSIKALTLTAVKKAGYKKGVLNLNEDELAWTNEDWKKDGSELIVSKRDGAILTPLKAGDSVIPANLAENLFKWGAIDPSMLHDKFVSKLPNVSSMSTTMQAPVTIESIITVNGNVDESVMPQLEELGKQLANNLNFQRDMTKVISHNLYKDAKKQGYRK